MSEIKFNGISEIVLMVRDVRAAAVFYRDVVGLTPENKADDAWAWFLAGPPDAAQRVALHRGKLLFEEHSPHPPGERFGCVHFALNTPRDRLEQAVARVRAAGVEVYGPQRFDWMNAESFYFFDLDGHLIEFWSPDP